MNTDVAPETIRTDRAWLALGAICAGVLMVVLDATIVVVALPSLVQDLHLDAQSLPWILNAYMLTFGGFLILTGRLGDLYGPRRILVLGVSVFSLASLMCGLSATLGALLIARAVQGLAGAAVIAVSLSLIVTLFPLPGDRAKALGLYGSICALGSTLGALLGGVIIAALSWHWIFFVNVPVGIVVCVLCMKFLRVDARYTRTRNLDVGGALTVTAALALAVYVLNIADATVWYSPRMLTLLSLLPILFISFWIVERRVTEPIVPLDLFRLRHFGAANLLAVLWAAASYGWFAISALYFQRVLGCSPLQVGLFFLPSTLAGAVISVAFSKRIVARYGMAHPVWMGILLFALGIIWFARVPLHGSFLRDVLPAMLLIGFGDGIGSAPLLLAAMTGVSEERSGLASGVVNTSWMLGGALGVAALFSVAEIRTVELRQEGVAAILAMDAGYQLALGVCATLTVGAAVFAALLLRSDASGAREPEFGADPPGKARSSVEPIVTQGGSLTRRAHVR